MITHVYSSEDLMAIAAAVCLVVYAIVSWVREAQGQG